MCTEGSCVRKHRVHACQRVEVRLARGIGLNRAERGAWERKSGGGTVQTQTRTAALQRSLAVAGHRSREAGDRQRN